ncbi:hypothetical protein [uncultured Sphingomonas sp.]|uniref:hypothetical protein n=1 Tax=uncultured Sphingomonas sp. TaxID=158754 RepID=UPI0025F7309A|nr:hypothetical protein [uncultured Sphingomonas sp.]
MTEAGWGDAASPEINWRTSAALKNVPRGDSELAEVTSLEGAVRAWLALDPAHRDGAVLTPEHALLIDGVLMDEVHGAGISALAERLPGAALATSDASPELDDAG